MDLNSNSAHCVTKFKLEEFEFCWEIENFSQIPSVAILKSPIFECGSINWQIRMTPNSVYSMSYRKPAHKSGIFFILYPIGSTPENSLAKPELHIKYKSQAIKHCSISSIQEFFKCEDIGNLQIFFPKMIFSDDVLRLSCKVKVYNPELVKNVLIPPFEEEFGDKFRDDWSNLYKSMENVDMSIKVGDDTLRAHKLILSTRSTVFATMFADEKESENVIHIDDFGVEDVRAMLEFIYTGQTEGVKKNPEILIKLAKKYNLPDLKSACGVQLSQGITIENAIDRLSLADRENALSLKSFVEKFIIRNKKEVFKTDAFKKLAVSGPFLDLFSNIIAQD